MDNKAKLYVFSRKEVVLVFIFMLLIAVTSFIFGVKVGKNFSYQLTLESNQVEEQESSNIDLLSSSEERAKSQGMIPQEQTKLEKEKALADETHLKLEEELKKLSLKEEEKVEEKKNLQQVEKKTEEKIDEKVEEKALALPTPERIEIIKDESETVYRGKYTVQLGSYRTIEDAEKFSDTFRIRGYNPIINEVEVKSVLWYRVNLGVFKTISEARAYIAKEKALFKNQDYVIGRFD